jgi:tryptophan-rich sensory protein
MFPVVWISIAFLRSISSILVYEQVGKLFCFPIMCLVLHLSIGDWWNFVTNKEKMLGVSAVGVLFVLSSAWFAIYQYYSVLPTAGFVLMPLGIWLSIATALVWSIWDINKPRMRLWPTKTL